MGKNYNDVLFCFQDYHSSTVVLKAAVTTLLSFNNGAPNIRKRKMSDNVHEGAYHGLPTPQPSDSESEDSVADLPLRKRPCRQMITDAHYQKLERVSLFA